VGGHAVGRGHRNRHRPGPLRPAHAGRGRVGLAVERPGGEGWKPCYVCGSVQAPVAVQAAGPDVAAAVAQARRTAAPPP
jgi:hypothetical protein